MKSLLNLGKKEEDERLATKEVTVFVPKSTKPSYEERTFAHINRSEVVSRPHKVQKSVKYKIGFQWKEFLLGYSKEETNDLEVND